MFPIKHSLSLFRRPGILAALLALSLITPISAFAQQAPNKPTLTDQTAEELGKIRVHTDARNWEPALALIDAFLPKVKPDTFDLTILLQVKSQILLQKNDLVNALQPLEDCLKIADKHDYLDEAQRIQMAYYLAQIYYQEGVSSKVAEVSAANLLKAEAYMKRFVERTTKPTVDATVFYASLLFNRAQSTMVNGKPDPALLQQALDLSDQALLQSTRPKENIYQLKLACLMQLGRNAEATDILELLLKLKPDNKTFWQQLAALYLNLGSEMTDKKDDQAAYVYQVRAILTMERAQALNFMTSQKENFNLIGIYFNIQLYEKAIELLEAGLKSGKVENSQKNWELLYYSYLQIKREAQAVEALKEATKHFPNAGQLEYLIAQTLYSLNKPEEAIDHLQACIAKGGTTKPHSAYMYLAYIAFEMKKYDIALEAINNAIKYPEGQKEGNNLKKAIETVIAEREAAIKGA